MLTAADTKSGGKAIKKAKLYTPNVANALQLASDAASTKRTVRQLKRITLKVEDMNGALALSYDIVAAEATSAKVFQFLCEQADVDIITFDVTNRMSFQIKRPWVDAAVKRSIYFEITYTPCLGDSAGRRYFFSNASNLVRLTGGKHLLLSSGATRDILLRSPYDVINVGILVGLTYGQALDAVSTSCLEVIARADKRRGKLDVVAETNTSSEDVVMQG
ncbi:Ribonuclease p protein subunit p30, partial [Globisporangium splendens]